MPIDLTYSPDIVDLVSRTEKFIADVVLPVENEFAGDITAAGGIKVIVLKLNAHIGFCGGANAADKQQGQGNKNSHSE